MNPNSIVPFKFEILEQIGPSGRPWITYAGRDRKSGAEVVARIANRNDARLFHWAEAVLAREARALSRFSHPRIYALLGSGRGFNVTERLRGGLFSWPLWFPDLAALIMRQVANAIEYAHSMGVFRLVPTSDAIRLCDGGVKLVDFRLARIADDDPKAPPLEPLRRQDLERRGGYPPILGHVYNEPGDACSDVFCLGAQLGTLLNEGEGTYPPPDVRSRDATGLLSPALGELVAACLSPDRAARPQTAAAVRDALDEILAEVGITDPDAELAAMVRDPVGYRMAFPARALAALESSPRAQARRGAHAISVLAGWSVLGASYAEKMLRFRPLPEA